MCPVFGREDHLLCGELPVDPQVGVVPGDRSFGLGRVEVIAFVLEDGLVAQYGKTVCESARYEELAVILGGQFDGDVFAERGRSAPYIDGDVQNPTLNDPYQFGLGCGPLLEMEPAQHAPAGFGFVVLHEAYGPDGLVELLLGVAFEEIAAVVAEDLRLDNNHVLDRGGNDFHYFCSRFNSSITLSRYCPYWFLIIGCASARIFSSEIQPMR